MNKMIKVSKITFVLMKYNQLINHKEGYNILKKMTKKWENLMNYFKGK